ncbi:MAG: signal recognition particle receptor subunit alpha, partial [Verrucomicrobia bacterium]|nr:signal recognition particle receptor subunit alpha [Cytophagales bacterium]
MGIFDFFKRNKTEEEKESLSKGLEKTKTSFLSKLSNTFFGRTKIDEEFLDDLEETLVSADVGIETTLKIISRFEARVAKEKYTGVNDLNRILKEEISSLLQAHNTKLNLEMN